MKNIVYCKSCKREIKVGHSCADRFALAEKLGKEFEVTCLYCKQKQTKNINSVYAVANGKFNFMALLITLILSVSLVYFVLSKVESTVYLYYILGASIVIPWMVYFVYKHEDNAKISKFNRNKY